MMQRSTKMWLWPAVLLLGGGIGALGGWWWNKPPTPWMEFTSLGATYTPGTQAIQTSGRYVVNEPCVSDDDEKKDLAVWRIEALATDTQIANYGPVEDKPNLSKGSRQYDSSIALKDEIYPDGWQVRILVTCRGRTPETIEEATLVEITDGLPPDP